MDTRWELGSIQPTSLHSIVLNKSKKGYQRKTCSWDNPLLLPGFSLALFNTVICLQSCWHESFQKRQFEGSGGAVHVLQINFYITYSKNIHNSTVIWSFQSFPFKKLSESRSSIPGTAILMQDMPQLKGHVLQKLELVTCKNDGFHSKYQLWI